MRKLTHEEFLNTLKPHFGEEITVLEQYQNRRTKILVRHSCGYEWRTNPHTLSTGHGCPVCKGNLKKCTETFRDEVKKLVGEEYTVLGDYVNTHTPILMKHNECGLEFTMSPKSFKFGQRCPNARYKSSAKSNMYPVEEIVKELKEACGDEYILVGGYKGSSRPAHVKHTKCGKVFRPTPRQLINKRTGCPNCYRSKGEDVVREYLNENGFVFKEQFRIKECRNKRALPFDFALFEGGNLIALIEYDGVQHYSPKFGRENFERTQKHDAIKNEYCAANSIPLIRVKYKRSENPEIFRRKVVSDLAKQLSDMAIPSQGRES